MNKHIMIASAIILGAAVAFAETPQLEQQLKELSSVPVDYAAAGNWFMMARKMSDNDQRQEALKAAATALIYTRKVELYQNSVRTQIHDATAFEDEFLKECPDCRGGGESRQPCPVCKGTGRCQYANCQGGRHRVHQINGDKYEACRECKGSGQCQKCNGRGDLYGKCARCGGKGKSMDKDLVLASYKNHADTAIRLVQEERERKERERQETDEKDRFEADRSARNITNESAPDKVETTPDDTPGDNNDDSPFRTVSKGRRPAAVTDGYTQGMGYLRHRHRNIASSGPNLGTEEESDAARNKSPEANDEMPLTHDQFTRRAALKRNYQHSYSHVRFNEKNGKWEPVDGYGLPSKLQLENAAVEVEWDEYQRRLNKDESPLTHDQFTRRAAVNVKRNFQYNFSHVRFNETNGKWEPIDGYGLPHELSMENAAVEQAWEEYQWKLKARP